MRALLAALLLAVPVAGCLELLKDPPEVEASADDMIGAAAAEARAWRSGAKLAAASTIEIEDMGKLTEENSTFTLPDDPEIGNGRGVGWFFAFGDPASGDVLILALAAHNRSVFLREEEKAEEADDKEEVARLTGEKWAVDSDAAVAQARSNATFRNAVGSGTLNWIVTYQPRAPDGEENGTAPAWIVVATGEAAGAVAMVNATSGEVRMARNFSGAEWGGYGPGGDFSPFAPKQSLYEETHDGQLTALATSAQHKFPVAREGAVARVALCYGRQTPTGAVALEILGPDGKPVGTVESTDGAAGPGSAVWQEGNLKVGEYTARLTLKPGGLAADYALDVEVWTGTSFDVFGPFGPFGC